MKTSISEGGEADIEYRKDPVLELMINIAFVISVLILFIISGIAILRCYQQHLYRNGNQENTEGERAELENLLPESQT